MLLCIPDVLAPQAAAAMRERILAAEWEDGGATAGAQSTLAKRNRQLPRDSAEGRRSGDEILETLADNALFLSAAMPLKIFPPLFNRYGSGESFGVHVDNAIRPVRGTPVRIRTDLSATLFLSDPDSYDGGELIIETAYGAQEVKLPAGSMVLYPSTSLHRVEPVTRGERVSSFFWMQSMVRDEGARAILFDMDQSIQSLAASLGHRHEDVIRLTGAYHNLVRRWADT